MNGQPVDLKAHFRDLVTACGGPKRAASLCHTQPIHISEMMAGHVPERWPRVDHVAILEADCGQPIVTTALADRIGYAIEAVHPDRENISAIGHLYQVTTETHQVVDALIAALGDGQIDEGERRDIRASAHRAIAALQRLCADLADGSAPVSIAGFGASNMRRSEK